MEVKLGSSVTFDFITSSFTTGEATDADSTPSFEVFESSTDTELTLSSSSIAKRTGKTGNYRATFIADVADGFESEKTYNVVATATVGSKVGKGVIGTFVCRTNTIDSAFTDGVKLGNTAHGGAAASLTLGAANVETAITNVTKSSDSIGSWTRDQHVQIQTNAALTRFLSVNGWDFSTPANVTVTFGGTIADSSYIIGYAKPQPTGATVQLFTVDAGGTTINHSALISGLYHLTIEWCADGSNIVGGALTIDVPRGYGSTPVVISIPDMVDGECQEFPVSVDGVMVDPSAGSVDLTVLADILEDTSTTIPTILETSGVKLGNTAHGGASATITFERVVGLSTTSNQPAVKLTGNGSAAAVAKYGGVDGPGEHISGGSGGGAGIEIYGQGGADGVYIAGGGTGSYALHLDGNSGGGLEVEAWNEADVVGKIFSASLAMATNTANGITLQGINFDGDNSSISMTVTPPLTGGEEITIWCAHLGNFFTEGFDVTKFTSSGQVELHTGTIDRNYIMGPYITGALTEPKTVTITVNEGKAQGTTVTVGFPAAASGWGCVPMRDGGAMCDVGGGMVRVSQTAPTAVENRQEMDANSTKLAEIVEDTGTTLPATLNTLSIYSTQFFRVAAMGGACSPQGWDWRSASSPTASYSETIPDGGFIKVRYVVPSTNADTLIFTLEYDAGGNLLTNNLNNEVYNAAGTYLQLELCPGSVVPLPAGTLTITHQNTVIGELPQTITIEVPQIIYWDNYYVTQQGKVVPVGGHNVVPAASDAPTAAAIRVEIDSNSTQLAAIVEDTGTTIPGLIGTPNKNLANDIASAAVGSVASRLLGVAGWDGASATLTTTATLTGNAQILVHATDLKFVTNGGLGHSFVDWDQGSGILLWTINSSGVTKNPAWTSNEYWGGVVLICTPGTGSISSGVVTINPMADSDETHMFKHGAIINGIGLMVGSHGELFADTGSAEWPVMSVHNISGPYETADANWDENLNEHTLPGSTGKKLRNLSDSLIYTGTAVSGTANTIVLEEGDSSEFNGAYDPAVISIIDGTGVGQTRMILEYKGHPDHTCIVDRDWKVIPDATSVVVISADAGREHVNEGLAQGATLGTITLNSLASANDDAYNAQVVFIRSGAGQDQARRILDYDGTTKVAIVSRDWSTLPDNTSAYVILPTGAISDNCIGRAVWSDLYGDYVGIVGSAAEALSNAAASGSGIASPVQYTPTGATRVSGDDDGGTWLDLVAHDDVYFATGEVAGVGLEVLVELAASTVAEKPTTLRVHGYYSGGGTHEIGVYTYDHNLSTWDHVGTMKTRSTPFSYSFPLTENNQDGSGAMSVKFIHEPAIYNPAHALYLDNIIWEKYATANAIASDLAQIIGITEGIDAKVVDIDNEVDAMDDNIAAMTEELGRFVSGSYTAGVVSNPYVTAPESTITLFANTDTDNILFMAGEQWSTYLQEAGAEVWFTVKENSRATTNLIDAQAQITDPATGEINLSLTAAQLSVISGTFFWQLQIRRVVSAGPPAVVTRRMVLEGKIYIKPTFKV